MRRARNEMSVELRKQKRGDQVNKRRNLVAEDSLDESDSESKTVSLLLLHLYFTVGKNS